MNISTRGALALVAAATVCAGLAHAQAAADTLKPNVIVVFVDDLGWTDLGCYGSSFYETPSIDRLAAQGAMFTRAYSSCNVCSPTRASLMTGKYPQRVGFTSYLNPNKPSGANSAATHLPASETTIGEAFQQAGYRTGYIGKWHVGSEEIGMPKQHGFDWQIATAKHGLPASYFFPYRRHRPSTADVPDLEDGKPGDYLTDVLTDKGIGFIKETVKEGKKPFFLVLGHYAVHTPIQAPKNLVEKYKAKKKRMYGTSPLKMIPERFNRKVPARQQNPTYAAMVENLDTNVGKVVDALDELGVTKDTIIVFTSDNGGSCMPKSRPTSNYPLRASKGWNYEGGIRIPTFITWPGNIKAMSSSEPVITMDIYPTLLELTGCRQVPEQTLDGKSLVPLIRGDKKTLNRPLLAWWYPHFNGHGTHPSQAILKDGWKLIHYIEENETELYHLDKDEGERNDIAETEPERTRELLATLNQWIEETRERESNGIADTASVIRDDWVRQAAAQNENRPLIACDDAAGGCDGIKDGSAGFHTQKEQNPWWQVDLGSRAKLGRIVIWNRTNDARATQRARRLVVRLSADGKTWEDIYRHDGSLFYGISGGPPLTVPTSGKNARYVRIGLADNEYFHLDEVEVFGAVDTNTNLALDRPATQSSESNWSTPRKKPASGLKGSYRHATVEALKLAAVSRALMPENSPIASYDTALAGLQKKFDEAAPDTDYQELYTEVRHLRRRLILSHPALDFDRLMINKRPPPNAHAHMCEQYLGRHSAAGPGLAILDSWKDRPRETVLLEGRLPEGSVLHPDLSFDAKRVIFSFCDHTPVVDDDIRLPIHRTEIRHGYNNQKTGARRFSIYEATIDGKTVRQLTATPSDEMKTAYDRATVQIEDLDPCYLPDGGFVFSSTRSQNFGRCHGGVYKPAFLLYRADADGSDIRPISFAEANEWDPSVLPDGRIIYTRWDYINRHNTWFQSLWVTRPDGTATAHYYGNYTRNPCVIAEARSIAGTGKVVATAAAHHFITGGSIIVVDPQRGQDGPEPLTRITPEVKFPETEGWGGKGCYATPYPLTEEMFLVAYSPQPINYGVRPSDAAFGIYLIDSLGGRELIYRDRDVSCFTPIPVRPRPIPPVLPSLLPASDEAPATGTCYVQNVYKCPQPIPQGSIKFLRINQIHYQPSASFTLRSRAKQEVVKSVIGIVPVNENGLAAFEVPADTGFQLQSLDENGMAVMTMRSLMYVRPGEVIGCVGCHEYQTPGQSASLHTPSKLHVSRPTPLPGPQYEGGFSFMRSVQPVLDRHCIRCHGLGEKPAGTLNLLGGKAYASLTRRSGLVAIAMTNKETFTSAPKDYFAHAGRLAAILMKGKMGDEQINIPQEDLARIIAWLDLNGQQFGDYSFNRLENRTPDLKGERRLREAIKETFGPAMAQRPFAALVNVGQPSESLILRAPLAIKAGGWGQVPDNGWDSQQHPQFRRFHKLVNAAITPLPYTDLQGTCSQQPCVCGSCWVRELTQ